MTIHLPDNNTVFHALSGGIDSVYSMWKWLKENPDKILIVHHVHYQSHEFRRDQESKAVKNVLKWFKDNNLTNFKYHESWLDTSSLGAIGYDTISLAALHGFVLKKYPYIRYILDNAPKDEVLRLGIIELENRKRKAEAIRKTITGKNFLPIHMLRHMTKKEIIEDMPKDLLELCWYCRRPQGDKPCHTCHTCKQVDEALGGK